MAKTALVSGNRGFLGRHFQAELERRGWQVDGFDLPEMDAIEFYRQNDTVYDLAVPAAYMVGGRAAIDGTNTNFMANLTLDAELFRMAVRTKQKRVLYFSSSAAYPVAYQTKSWVDTHRATPGQKPRQDYVRLRENDIDLEMGQDCWENAPTYPDANYGWAKLMGERLAEDARRNGLAVTVVRPFSGYGEDQSLDYPFPSIVARARTGDLSVWGPPGQCRDWIHVDDVVRGSLAVVDSGTTDPVNLCTGVATEMGELAQKIRGYAGNWDNFPRGATYLEDRPTGVFYRVGDPTRMLQYYTPEVTIEEGIRRALYGK